MGDFPTTLLSPPHTVIGTGSLSSLLGEICRLVNGNFNSSGGWPAANRALYMPFMVEVAVTAYLIAWQNGSTISGNLDVGIYSVTGARLVSTGSIAHSGASTVQTGNIADTVLTPGVYYVAMNVDNTTGTFFRTTVMSGGFLRVYGMQQQAVGAVTLPDPATFANPASAYLPLLCVCLKATV